MNSIKITILVDNTARTELASEHGFAVWIQASGRNILFDTGQGTAFWENVERLTVPLEAADAVVLSHGHYDHTGGLPGVIERAAAARLYCHPHVVRQRYAVRDGVTKAIGMSDPARAAVERLSPEKRRWITAPEPIGPDMGVTGPIPRETRYEDTGGPFFLDTAATRPDAIEDDMALWLGAPKGLIVIAGCSHAGLINTLSHIRRLSGGARIHAVIGGFHLVEASDARMAHTIEALEQIAPDLIVPCHCTGEPQRERLAERLGSRVVFGCAGAVYEM